MLAPTTFGRLLCGAVIAALLARRGLRKNSLSPSGSRAAFVVAFLSWGASVRFGTTLLAFYWSSTKFTRWGEALKRSRDSGHKPGGQRDAGQVLACSAVGTAVALLFAAVQGEHDAPVDYTAAYARSWLLCAYLGHYACCAADTWASELGMLESGDPFLITTGRRVPPGTNGGVSVTGTLASALGGGFIGAIFFAFDVALLGPGGHDPAGHVWHLRTLLVLHLVSLGAAAGLFGSLLDSLLGATVQATYYDTESKTIVQAPGPGVRCICGRPLLTNHQVNFVSVLATTVLAGFAGASFV